LKIELGDRTEPYEHDEHQQIQNSIIGLIEKNSDIFMLKRDWGDLVLVMKGGTSEYLEEERDLLLAEIRLMLANTRYKLTVGLGATKKRIADICGSFAEAMAYFENPVDDKSELSQSLERMELLQVDKSAVENYLHGGVKDEFDEFFNTYLRPLNETALKSNLIKNYIFVDVVLAVTRLVNDLDGEIDKVIPELNSIEMIMSNIKTIEQLREQVCQILSNALAYRDSQPRGQYMDLICQAKQFIECHYKDPELSLNVVAAHANLSASHFSVVFSHETGQTFKDHLTEIRINKAKELLRMTALRSADIAYQVGYNDPHYFSSVFKKHTSLSPIEYRSRI